MADLPGRWPGSAPMSATSDVLLESETATRWLDKCASLVVVGCIAGTLGLFATVGGADDSAHPVAPVPQSHLAEGH